LNDDNGRIRGMKKVGRNMRKPTHTVLVHQKKVLSKSRDRRGTERTLPLGHGRP